MHQEPQNSNHPSNSPPQRSGPLQAFKAVAWAFLGVRKRAGHETDARLTPAQVIVTGLICAAIFIGILLTVVSLVLP
jgi:hypothetical protein